MNMNMLRMALAMAFLFPLSALAADPSVVQIQASGARTCAVFENGTMNCWGDNYGGQIGDGTAQNYKRKPVPLSLQSVANLSINPSYSCATLTNGKAKCWGYNAYGQLGDGTRNQRYIPTDVYGLFNAESMTTSRYYTCAMLTSGDTKCWGHNRNNVLGNGTEVGYSFYAPKTIDTLTGVKSLSSTYYTSCAVFDGSVQCVGYGHQYRESSDEIRRRYPFFPIRGITHAKEVSSGHAHACALLDSGEVKCWGSGNYGQMGDGDTNHEYTPITVSGITNATKLVTGNFHTCALLDSGEAKCWGYNMSGQIGNSPTYSGYVLTPVTVSGLSNITDITAGDNHTCAVDSNQTYCWGANYRGQLGDGTTTTRRTPVRVSPFVFPEVASSSHGLSSDGGSSVWSSQGNGILYDQGSVSIGTVSSSDRSLNVSGSALFAINTPGVVEGILLQNTESGQTATQYALQNNTGTKAAMYLTSSDFGSELSDTLGLWNYGDGSVILGTNNHERMRIAPSGNVGIGTDSPTEALEVNGNIKLSGAIISDGDICIGACEGLFVQSAAPQSADEGEEEVFPMATTVPTLSIGTASTTSPSVPESYDDGEVSVSEAYVPEDFFPPDFADEQTEGGRQEQETEEVHETKEEEENRLSENDSGDDPETTPEEHSQEEPEQESTPEQNSGETEHHNENSTQENSAQEDTPEDIQQQSTKPSSEEEPSDSPVQETSEENRDQEETPEEFTEDVDGVSLPINQEQEDTLHQDTPDETTEQTKTEVSSEENSRNIEEEIAPEEAVEAPAPEEENEENEENEEHEESIPSTQESDTSEEEEHVSDISEEL